MMTDHARRASPRVGSRLPLQARFETGYVPEPNSGCWLWLGDSHRTGYGRMMEKGRALAAHRVSYELHRGPIPAGMTLDHLCRVRICVNPLHLEPVTHKENCRRGHGWSGRNARKTHCNKGHEFTTANTYRNWAGRKCRTCMKENNLKQNERRRLFGRKRHG